MNQPAANEYAAFQGEVVVIDTLSRFLYIGRFVETTESFVVLADADAHDMSDSRTGTTKETYIRDAKQFGVKDNRKEVRVIRDKVIAITRLSDVVDL